MTIWKYQLEIDDVVTVQMPLGARILSLQTQDNIPCLWAMVNPTNPKERRYFLIVGTGHELPNSATEGTYIGTTQTHDGRLVWHVFEVPA